MRCHFWQIFLVFCFLIVMFAWKQLLHWMSGSTKPLEDEEDSYALRRQPIGAPAALPYTLPHMWGWRCSAEYWRATVSSHSQHALEAIFNHPDNDRKTQMMNIYVTSISEHLYHNEQHPPDGRRVVAALKSVACFLDVNLRGARCSTSRSTEVSLRSHSCSTNRSDQLDSAH